MEASPKRTMRKPPESMIYETMDGKPIYRKGYKAVLIGAQKPEDFMGISTLQAEIVAYLLRQLMRFYDEQQYTIHTNEAGLHIGKGDNLAGDILVYQNSVLIPKHINKNIPPYRPCWLLG